MRMLPFTVAFFLAAAAQAERPGDYAFGVPVAPAPGAAFVRVALPASVYEGSARRDLADLRVFNADGEVVPHARLPRPAAPRELSPAVALPMYPLHVERDRRGVDGLSLSIVRNAAGTTIGVNAADGEPAANRVLAGYVLDASALDEPVAALSFALPEAAGTATMRMRVDASDDLAAWRTVVPDATLVDLAVGDQRLTRNRVELAPTKAKYLRLSWAPGAAAIGFTGVAAEAGARAVEAPRQWRAVAGTRVADREDDYAYDLGGAFPVDRIAVDLAAPNSIVPAQLFARATPAEAWQPVGSTVFYRLSAAGSDVASPPFAVAGGERRHWLLRVDPRSGAAAAGPPPLRAGGQPQEIVFAARGPGPFTLAFGREPATAGALPIATLIPGYDAARELPASVAVGHAGERVALGGPDRLRKPPDVKRWALWVALALGALVLGWMAWRLSREMAATDAARPHDAGEKAGPSTG